MNEDLDASEGARIFKALHQAQLPTLRSLHEEWFWEDPPDPDSPYLKPPVRYSWRAFNVVSQPETKMQALMETIPHEETAISYEEVHEEQEQLIEAVQEVWETLTDTERWIYHMLVDIGLSMRLVAQALGTPKTTFARRRDALAEKLKNELLRHEAVINHFAKDLQHLPDESGIDLES